ncbi:uncharacterized protein LOC144910036 isoform X2 [Branchiostoma floridae x Branchiostoma belcheri]
METSVPAPCLRQYDTEDDLLRDYWRRGYQYSEISLFLSQFHNVHLKFEAMTDITSSSGGMRLDVPPDDNFGKCITLVHLTRTRQISWVNASRKRCRSLRICPWRWNTASWCSSQKRWLSFTT